MGLTRKRDVEGREQSRTNPSPSLVLRVSSPSKGNCPALRMGVFMP